jgi:hypothetical protein
MAQAARRSARPSSEVDGVAAAAALELGELVFGAGEADREPLDLAEPASAFGLGDPGEQVVADLRQPVALGGVWPKHWALDTRMLVDARGAERPCAGADGDLLAFEVGWWPRSGTAQWPVSGSRRVPSAARNGWGVSAAHSAIAAIDRAPASTAAAARPRMATSGWRRPARVLGSAMVAR